MVEEVAEVAGAGVVNDADLSDRIEILERQFICESDDLFCNAQDRADDNNSMAPLLASMLMSLFLLVL